MSNVRQADDSETSPVFVKGEIDGTLAGRIQIGHDQVGIWKYIEKTVTIGTNNANTEEKGMDIGFAVGQISNFSGFLYSVKDFKIVEVPSTAFVPENVDANYTIEVEDVDGQAVLTITGPESVVYFMAYNETAKEVKFGKGNVSAVESTISIGADDTFKYMIWDSNMKPLCNTFMGSEF